MLCLSEKHVIKAYLAHRGSLVSIIEGKSASTTLHKIIGYYVSLESSLSLFTLFFDIFIYYLMFLFNRLIQCVI